MSVIFESIIKIDSNGQWFIELRDMSDNRVAFCLDVDEYSQKVEDFGSDYGGHIDEVRWSKAENVPPHIMDEIRLEMAAHQAELAEKKGESLNK